MIGQKRENCVEKDHSNQEKWTFEQKKTQKRELEYQNSLKKMRNYLRVMNLSEGFVPFGEHII